MIEFTGARRYLIYYAEINNTHIHLHRPDVR